MPCTSPGAASSVSRWIRICSSRVGALKMGFTTRLGRRKPRDSGSIGPGPPEGQSCNRPKVEPLRAVAYIGGRDVGAHGRELRRMGAYVDLDLDLDLDLDCSGRPGPGPRAGPGVTGTDRARYRPLPLPRASRMVRTCSAPSGTPRSRWPSPWWRTRSRAPSPDREVAQAGVVLEPGAARDSDLIGPEEPLRTGLRVGRPARARRGRTAPSRSGPSCRVGDLHVEPLPRTGRRRRSPCSCWVRALRKRRDREARAEVHAGEDGHREAARAAALRARERELLLIGGRASRAGRGTPPRTADEHAALDVLELGGARVLLELRRGVLRRARARARRARGASDPLHAASTTAARGAQDPRVGDDRDAAALGLRERPARDARHHALVDLRVLEGRERSGRPAGSSRRRRR